MKKKYQNKNDHRDRALYADVLSEIKKRNTAIYDALNGFAPPQPKIILAEFCYLQLRFICELIALGCLVAHGDLRGGSKHLLKRWHAGDIVKDLEKLHPNFYPRPTKQILDTTGKVERLEPVRDPFLSKEELIQLYGWLGDRLHKGSVKRLLLSEKKKIDFPKIDQIASKIRNLLNHHCIELLDPNFQIWALMQSKIDGNVQVTLVQKIEDTE